NADMGSDLVTGAVVTVQLCPSNSAGLCGGALLSTTFMRRVVENANAYICKWRQQPSSLPLDRHSFRSFVRLLAHLPKAPFHLYRYFLLPLDVRLSFVLPFLSNSFAPPSVLRQVTCCKCPIES